MQNQSGTNWDDLRVFLAVARLGSVSGAARHLDVQHSTVSRRLQQLERRLGVRLLDRKRSGYQLTAAGESLQQATQRMEREVLTIDSALQGLDSHLGGTLRVTAVNIMAGSVLAPVFARFSTAYPEIDLQIVVANTDLSLAEREADVAIRVTNTPMDTLMGKKLARIASTVYGSRDYVERMKRDDLAPEWIGASCCDYHKRWTQTLSAGKHHRVLSDDPNLTLQLIKQHVGLGVLPCYLADPDPDLIRYADPIPEMDVDLWFLFHTDLKRSERIYAFREFMAAELVAESDLLEGNRLQDK